MDFFLFMLCLWVFVNVVLNYAMKEGEDSKTIPSNSIQIGNEDQLRNQNSYCNKGKLNEGGLIENHKPYSSLINLSNPTAFIFIINLSDSMNKTCITYDRGEMSLSKAVQRIINKIIRELVNRCVKGADVRHYYDIAVLGYGNDVHSLWMGNLENREFVSPIEIDENVYKFNKRTKQVPTHLHGIVTKEIEERVWIEYSEGNCQSRMDLAFKRAKVMLTDWIETHPNSYPPTVIHITDRMPIGISEDVVIQEAKELKSMHTNNGNVLLFNFLLGSDKNATCIFPMNESEVMSNQYGSFLYDMSSLLPMRYNNEIKMHKMGGYKDKQCVAMAVNISIDVLAHLMYISTSVKIFTFV